MVQEARRPGYALSVEGALVLDISTELVLPYGFAWYEG